jgi:hypothetical protein
VVATHVDVSSDRAPFLRNTWNPFYVSGLIITSDAFSAEGIEHRVRNQGQGSEDGEQRTEIPLWERLSSREITTLTI